MSDRKTPTFNRQGADEHHADQTQADVQPGQRAAYAEDPLVELARIVSESAHASPASSDVSQGARGRAGSAEVSPPRPELEPQLEPQPEPQPQPQPRTGTPSSAWPEPAQSSLPPEPQASAEPREYSLPDEFGSDLEAELIAELAPSYSPQPEPRREPGMDSRWEEAPRRPAQPARVATQPLPRATPHVPTGDAAPRSIPASEARAAQVRTPAEPEPSAPAGPQPGTFFDPMGYSTAIQDPAPARGRAASPDTAPMRPASSAMYLEPEQAEVEDPASYADAAAAALEAAVQDELRLSSLGGGHAGGEPAPEPVYDERDLYRERAPVPSYEPDAYRDADPMTGAGDYAAGYDEPMVRAPDDPMLDRAAPGRDALAPDVHYPAEQAGMLRGSFDQGGETYGTPRYGDAPAPYAKDPAAANAGMAEPGAPLDPRFDPDDMQWPDEAPQGEVPGYEEPRFAAEQYPQGPGDPVELDDLFEAENDVAPVRVPQGVLPEHSAAERRAAPQSEPRRRGVIAAAALGAIVVVGGGIFLIGGLFGDDGPSGPPERIAAASGPFKVFPEAEQAASEPSPSKAIYDRVAGVEPRDEQLVPREEQPISSVPTTDDGDPRAATSPQSASRAPAQPKRVRTVVVRPDGTIIAAPDLPGSAASSETPQATPTLNTAPQAAPGADATIRTVATQPAEDMTSAVNGGGRGQDAPRVPSTPEQAGQPDNGNGADAASRVASVSLTPRPKPAVPEGRVASTGPSASSGRSGPLDLTAGTATRTAQAPAASTTAADIPAGSYVVQVSSQRTREQAEQAYASMQRRFPSILGNVQAVYPSVDLGDRGTFYRVRIVAGGEAEADDLCSRLKAAGGDCFVRRAP